MDWPKITVDTPLEEVNAIHKRIWDYAIKHGEKPHTPYNCNCAFCEYAFALSDINHKAVCVNCPSKTLRCYGDDFLYDRWDRCEDPDERHRLAIQIRDVLDIEKEEANVRNKNAK